MYMSTHVLEVRAGAAFYVLRPDTNKIAKPIRF